MLIHSDDLNYFFFSCLLSKYLSKEVNSQKLLRDLKFINYDEDCINIKTGLKESIQPIFLFFVQFNNNRSILVAKLKVLNGKERRLITLLKGHKSSFQINLIHIC